MNDSTASNGRLTRAERDERASILFQRMLSREPVWVNSPLGQIAWIQMVALEDSGELIAYDHEGNDRWVEDYLLDNPGRLQSSTYGRKQTDPKGTD